MDYDLIPYRESLTEFDAEGAEALIARQFSSWEERGRGWQIHNFPVELEPSFRPFFYFVPDAGPVGDDGRVPTLLSQVAQTFLGRSKDTSLGTPNSRITQLQEYSEYLAELDEPDFCSYYEKQFVELRLVLPRDLTVPKLVAEQLILSLAYLTCPVSFEVIGTEEDIVVHYAAGADDIPHLKQQLEARLPQGSFLIDQPNQNYLASTWKRSGSFSVIADFGLSEEFFLPLRIPHGPASDLLITIVGALSDLVEGEVGIFQVVFQKARHDWMQELSEIVELFDGTGFFDHIPEYGSSAKQKLNSPFYAVVVRVAAKAPDVHDSWRIVRSISSGLALLSKPSGNQLIPLSNDAYDANFHEEAFLKRYSFRSGMLLNLEEVSALVSPPSESVRTPRLLRASDRTKHAPQTAFGNTLLLGENPHRNSSSSITLSNEQRTRHVHVIGSSGSGKSTLLLSLIKQDIDAGEGVCVIDPHGDLIDEVVARIPESRIEETILFDPSDADFPIGFNILQANSELEKTVLSSDLIATFRRLSTSWGDVMDSVLANAILAFVESAEGGTLLELRRFLVEKQFRSKFLETVSDESVRYFWDHEFQMLANKPQASILVRLDTFLRQKLIRNIVCQKKSAINFREAMDTRKILLIKLSQGLIGTENAHLLGTLLVSKLHQAALSRQDTAARPFFWLYLDEFQHFITPSMESILSGSRKYNLGMTLSHQEFRQLQSRSQEVASSVLTNCYTRICFRLGDTDAEKFSSGFSYFDARSLQNLGIGEAIARIERSEFDFNLKVRPVPEIDGELIEKRKKDVIEFSRGRYATPIKELEAIMPIDPPARTFSNPDPGQVKAEAPSRKYQSTETPWQTPDKSEKNDPVSLPSIQFPNDRQNSQHRYLQILIKRLAEQREFRVYLEKEVLGGAGRIDITLEDDTRKIACEVSVTNAPEFEVQNILKCFSAGFSPVIMVCPDTKHMRKIRQKAENALTNAQLEMTKFFSPEQMVLWVESLDVPNKGHSNKVKGFKVKLSVAPSSDAEKKTRKRAITDVIFGALKRINNKDPKK